VDKSGSCRTDFARADCVFAQPVALRPPTAASRRDATITLILSYCGKKQRLSLQRGGCIRQHAALAVREVLSGADPTSCNSLLTVSYR
jgi:hypothetical protein